MRFYRCYNVGLDRSACKIKRFVAPNDVEAFRQANMFAEDGSWHGVEIWEGPRKVGGCLAGLACGDHSQTLH